MNKADIENEPTSSKTIIEETKNEVKIQTADIGDSTKTAVSCRNKSSGFDSIGNSAHKMTFSGGSFSMQTGQTKRSQLCTLPEFTPIEEGQEPDEFIKGFEKFAEDVQGYMISADEQFSSVANRRLPNHGRLRDTANALKKAALRAKEFREFSPSKIISPISPRSRVLTREPS